MSEKKVGTITHYFDKIGVAVIELKAQLKVGDKIKIVDGDNEFEQEVTSMQIEHEAVSTAKKGQSVGMKINESVKKGCLVSKVE